MGLKHNKVELTEDYLLSEGFVKKVLRGGIIDYSKKLEHGSGYSDILTIYDAGCDQYGWSIISNTDQRYSSYAAIKTIYDYNCLMNVLINKI